MQQMTGNNLNQFDICLMTKGNVKNLAFPFVILDKLYLISCYKVVWTGCSPYARQSAGLLAQARAGAWTEWTMPGGMSD